MTTWSRTCISALPTSSSWVNGYLVRAGASLTLIFGLVLAVILGIGDVRPPAGRAFGDGQVRHELVRAGAMPVLLAVGCEDDVAGTELGDLLSADLDQAAAFGDVQGCPPS
jgi:hypothetical protein